MAKIKFSGITTNKRLIHTECIVSLWSYCQCVLMLRPCLHRSLGSEHPWVPDKVPRGCLGYLHLVQCLTVQYGPKECCLVQGVQ